MTFRLKANAPHMTLPERPKLGWTCYSDGVWHWERNGTLYQVQAGRISVNGYHREVCESLAEAMFWCETDAANRKIDNEIARTR
jgi:hypothetical protein